MGRSCDHFMESIKVGPWGGNAGTKWSYKPKSGITEIIIRHAVIIDSIIFKSDDGFGGTEWSDKFGGNGGTKTDKILIDWPSEFLTTISGTCKNFCGEYVTQSISFYTNRAKYGPFGSDGGKDFNFSLEGAIIVGFHGRSGNYVDALGIYVKPTGSFCCCQEQHSTLTQKVNNVMIDDAPRGPGPWGGSKGKTWDDGVFDAIQQVLVYVSDGMIHGIQIMYQTKNEKSFLSRIHGGSTDDVLRITLDSASEYIVGIMGFYGSIENNDGSEAIRAICFYTNKGKYGPFGNETGTAFTSTVCDGKVVGFHGRSGVYLDALGVHMEFF